MSKRVTSSASCKDWLTTTGSSVIRWTILFCLVVFHQCHAAAGGVLELTTTVSACNLTSVQNRSAVCRCTESNIICSGRDLTDVPTDFLPTAVLLDLSFNRIKSINDTAFIGLELLETLYLQNNLISTIDPYAFKNLYSLQILNLENNQLTSLDPTQNLFQHLPSLTRLNVQSNNITSIKRLSFLTLGSTAGVSIKFAGNPINCNCDVLALRNWLPTLTTRNIEFDNLICDNDPQKRPYDKFPIGNCNDTGMFDNSTYSFTDGISTRSKIKKEKENNRDKTKDKKEKNNKDENIEDSSDDVEDDGGGGGDLTYQGYLCPVCNNERTSYACRQNKNVECPDDKKMCHMTFVWNRADSRMSISSRCEGYDDCLKQEMNNIRTCIQNNSQDINCNFCCLGPTCVDSSIGGRTKDLEFILTYVKSATALNNAGMSNHSSEEFKQEEGRIARGLLSDITGFMGGVDIYASKFEPIISKQQVRVFLKLELTVLSTMPDSTAENEIKVQIANSLSSPI
ncbi:hypothetical protein Btru_071547, partial [Bulinus truncatus]